MRIRLVKTGRLPDWPPPAVIAGGFLSNPLMLTVFALGALLLLFRAVSARAPRLECSRREKVFLLILGGAALLANWIYIIVSSNTA